MFSVKPWLHRWGEERRSGLGPVGKLTGRWGSPWGAKVRVRGGIWS